MTRVQKIIISIILVVFLGGIGGAFSYFSHQEAPISNKQEAGTLPVREASLPVTSPQEEVPSAQAPSQDTATVSSKADAEKMLQETEDDFQGLDADLSAQ